LTSGRSGSGKVPQILQAHVEFGIDKPMGKVHGGSRLKLEFHP
jgi:hypothetical protein